MINLTDPGWCRTDLGGPHAPNAPESAIPGIVVGVFVEDKKFGRYLNAPYFFRYDAGRGGKVCGGKV